MRLSHRALERTLLLRQHLLERTDADPLAMIEHLIGLQGQDNLPPYLSLAARIEGFDPRALSRAITEREAVRFLSLRGTVHVLTATDALFLRAWVQPSLDRLSGTNTSSRPARHLDGPDLVAEIGALLGDGPLPVKRIGELLAMAHPDAPAAALSHLARERAPLVQVPPRGLWRRSGGVIYAHLEDWLGAPQGGLDLPAVVRRYLRAYGPAAAADLTTWSGVTRLGPLFAEMAAELEVYEGPEGKPLYDVSGAPIADEDQPAPARLLGRFDNVWLAHAARDRVLSGPARRRWAGPNGGVGNLLLLDGRGEGIWTVQEGRVVVDSWRTPTGAERRELDEEIERVEALLAVPPDRKDG